MSTAHDSPVESLPGPRPNPLSRSMEQKTMCGAFQHIVSTLPDKVALQNHDRSFQLSWGEVGERVRAVSAGFAGFGLERGDTVALLIPNCPEHHLLDYALMHLGVTTFGIYVTSSVEQVTHQLMAAGAAVAITDAAGADKLATAVAALPTPITVVLIEEADSVDWGATPVLSLSAVEAMAVPEFDFEATWRAVRPEDVLMLVFTSGTTGTPKCAEYTHAATVAQMVALNEGVPINRDQVISFLPLAHTGGRLSAHYLALTHGATITTCDMLELVSVVADVRPDTLLAVTRLFEKFQSAVEAGIDALPPADGEVVRRGISLGMLLAAAQESGEEIPPEQAEEMTRANLAARELVRPILDRLGLGRLVSAYTGGGPVPPDLTFFFRAIGVPLLESFGSTETGLAIFNRIDKFKVASAGQALPGAEIRRAEDGEMLVRAPFMMRGYRGNEEAMRNTFDEDGWLHTGDIIELDDEGFVKFVDRMKEILISSSGKTMSPIAIEGAIKSVSSMLGAVVAVGDGRKYATALLTLSAEAVPGLARTYGLDPDDLEAMCADPRIVAEVAKVVEAGNQKLSRPEQIKKFVLIPQIWLPGGDELTPTMKTKRRVITRKYATQIDSMYDVVATRWPTTERKK